MFLQAELSEIICSTGCSGLRIQIPLENKELQIQNVYKSMAFAYLSWIDYNFKIY